MSLNVSIHRCAWVDKELAILLFPNITRSFEESYQAFGYVEDVPHFTRYVDALFSSPNVINPK